MTKNAYYSFQTIVFLFGTALKGKVCTFKENFVKRGDANRVK